MMKHRYFALFIIIIFHSFTFSQSFLFGDPYDVNSGHWNITNKNTQGISYESLLYSWQPVTIPGNLQAVSIIFADSLNGWLGHTYNGVARSTNGGVSWDTLNFRDTTFSGVYNSVYFINNSTGWATGSAIQIRKTTNGGANWFKQYGPPVAGIAHSIYFFNANTGFIFGSKNFPYVPFGAKTTNGGTNWTEITLSFSGAQELNKQFWINSTTGWVAGYNVLLRTTDGGTTFTNLFSTVPPTGNGYNDLLCIFFADAQTGWLGGSNLDKQNIYRTTNAGSNWTFQTNPVSVNNTYVQINDIEFMTPDSGWAIHGTPFSGAIMFTANGGANWIIEEGSSHWFNALSYYQRKKAWTCADGTVWIANLQLVGLSQIGTEIPKEHKLYQNYPNPFNPATKIRFSLPSKLTSIKFTVFDVMGRSVKNFAEKDLKPGNYEFDFDGTNLTSGVYFYRLESGGFVQTNKMVLLK